MRIKKKFRKLYHRAKKWRVKKKFSRFNFLRSLNQKNEEEENLRKTFEVNLLQYIQDGIVSTRWPSRAHTELFTKLLVFPSILTGEVRSHRIYPWLYKRGYASQCRGLLIIKSAIDSTPTNPQTRASDPATYSLLG